MNFDALQHECAKKQLVLLGAVNATVQKREVTLPSALVVIDKNVAVPLDNGVGIERRTVATLLSKEVGLVERGNLITLGSKQYTVNDVLDDDGFVIRVFLRG